ncbi:MAG: hypothetical protein ACI4JQ_00505 [Ruminococcus sp.]
MFILFPLTLMVVLFWVGFEMMPSRKRKRELQAEKVQQRKPFWESCASRGLDILPADENEKRIIGKKIFRQELIRSIPALITWMVFFILPIALEKEQPLIFLGCIGVLLLLCMITLRFYLLHPFALLEGNFDLYGGLCQQTREYEHDGMPDERQVQMNDVWLDVDAIRFKVLKKNTSFYYYIAQFYHGKEYLFLRTDDIAAESRNGEYHPDHENAFESQEESNL